LNFGGVPETVVTSFQEFAKVEVDRITSAVVDWDSISAETRQVTRGLPDLRREFLRRGWKVSAFGNKKLETTRRFDSYLIRATARITPGVVHCWHDLESEDRSRILIRDSFLARFGLSDLTDIRGLGSKRPSDLMAFAADDAEQFATFVRERLASSRGLSEVAEPDQ